MNWLKQQLPSFLVFALCVIILICFFPQLIFDLNTYLFGGGGDSIKNYFVPAWFVKYDGGMTFTGMFYPLTENILFPEGPLMGWFIHLLKSVGLPVEHHVVGIINFLMFLSYPFAAMFLYKIIKHYSTVTWWSIIMSIIIASLSPQFNRFIGHYSLAYMCIIPMLWWFTIQLLEKGKRAYIVVLFLFMLIIGFIHAYFIAIGTLFISTYVIALFWFERKWNKTYIWALFVAIAPLLLYMAIAAITDSVVDRHSRPYGFYRYHADLKSVFLPHSGFVYDWLQSFIPFKNQRYEGWAYVGLFGAGFFLYFIIRQVIRLVRKKDKRTDLQPMPIHLKAMLLSSIVLLVLAFCPFKLGLEWFVELIKPLRQFRSLGRLAWIFFYVFSVFYGVYIIKWFNQRRSKRNALWLTVILIGSIAIPSLEAYAHLQHTAKQINHYKTANVFNGKQNLIHSILEAHNYNASDFQSILVFPYFSIGNEKIYIEGKDQSLLYASRASYETGLPMSQFYSSRSSIYASLQLMSLVSHPALPKPILNAFPNNKPILLLVSSNQLEETELKIVQKATKIGSAENIDLFRLDLNDLKSENQKIMEGFWNNQAAWFSDGPIYTMGSQAHYIQLSNTGQPFEKGTYSKERVMIYNDKLPFLLDSARTFDVSFWLKVDDLTAGLHEYFFRAYNKENELVERFNLNPKVGRNVYQDWVQHHHAVTLDEHVSRIEVEVKGKHITYESFWIRPVNEDVVWYQEETGQFIWNNFPLNDY